MTRRKERVKADGKAVELPRGRRVTNRKPKTKANAAGGARRSPVQREKDLEVIASMYLRGRSQGEIGEELGITRQMVSLELRRLYKMWRSSALRDFDDLQARELAKIDRLETTYWEGWERSVRQRQKSVSSKSSGLAASGKTVDLNRAQIERADQVGDPRFLAGVERCIERRCKVMGLDAPERLELTGRGGGPVKTESSTTLDERIAKYVAVFADEAEG